MKLEDALDELYGVTPAEFIATRKRLAKDVPELAGRKKPTVGAYVLNQLVRRHRDEVEELVDVGRQLARAQRRGEGLREAIEKQRAIVASVVKRADAVMKEIGVSASAHHDEVATALHAALVDAAVGEALEQGHLEKAPEAVASFPSIVVTAPAPAPAHAHAHAPPERTAKDRHATERERAEREHAQREEAAKRERAEREEAKARERAERAEAAKRERAEREEAKARERAQREASKKSRAAAIATAREAVSAAERTLREARAALKRALAQKI